jgi:hypothetical protein
MYESPSCPVGVEPEPARNADTLSKTGELSGDPERNAFE